MADIKQAAQWMSKGHTVRSSQRLNGIYAQEGTGAFFNDDGGGRTQLDLDDLLDETWEKCNG